MAQFPVAHAQNILPNIAHDWCHFRSCDWCHFRSCAMVRTTGSCATPVMTEGHVTPLEVSLGRSLRRPRPIFSMVTGTSHPRPIFSMVTGEKSHPACLWRHWEVCKYHRSIDKWKDYKLRKRYKVTKKVLSYQERYEVTKKVRRCYERLWLWSYTFSALDVDKFGAVCFLLFFNFLSAERFFLNTRYWFEI
jgi:hypothetical protein